MPRARTIIAAALTATLLAGVIIAYNAATTRHTGRPHEASLRYSIQGIFAIVNATPPQSNGGKTGGNTTLVFIIRNAELTITPLNASTLKYTLKALIEESNPLNNTNHILRLRSSGVLPHKSPLGRLLLPHQGTTINICNTTLEPAGKSPQDITYLSTAPCTAYLAYSKVTPYGPALSLYAYSKPKAPIDATTLQLIDMILAGNPSLEELLHRNTEHLSGIHILMGLEQASNPS